MFLYFGTVRYTALDLGWDDVALSKWSLP